MQTEMTATREQQEQPQEAEKKKQESRKSSTNMREYRAIVTCFRVFVVVSFNGGRQKPDPN